MRPGPAPASSYGSSDYKALILGFKRRMYKGLDLTGTYTLADAKSTVGTAGDELNSNNLQDATLLYDDPRVFGPIPADRRPALGQRLGRRTGSVGHHRLAVLLLAHGAAGVDHDRRRHQRQRREQRPPGPGLPVRRRRQGSEGHRCVRNLELRARREANPVQPAREQVLPAGRLARRSRRLARSSTSSTPRTRRLSSRNASSTRFMQPNEYAGDFQNPEQRVGQIGFRFSF